MINGVGPDTPVETNERGGRQSAIPYAFHLCDPDAMFALAKVLAEGAQKYAPNNWRLIPPEEHINHMICHAYAWLAGDRQDEHLEHALARAMMAVATQGDKQ